MARVNGLYASHQHSENGMTLEDMAASLRATNKYNEVIIFRSTGPWSMRWIERDYPTKNFHVKGKSSDWGPQAGFVPRLGMYSKVGGDEAKEAQGDKYNNDGLDHKYAGTTQLCLTREELDIQLTRKAAGRTALTKMLPVSDLNKDFFLYAKRSADSKEFAFRAVFSKREGHYKIFVFHRTGAPLSLSTEKYAPLEVMTSSEVGAMNKPLTGDYDLMAVCPSWGNYGSRSVATIHKPGVDFGRTGGAESGQTFQAGANLDAVLDMRTNTGAKGTMKDGKRQTYGGITGATYDKRVKATPGMSHEHGDMGNLTPRILRCINLLNIEMGQSGPFRRVHHNAESHRNVIFGGITGADMARGEGFPLTAFLPLSIRIPGYDQVCTLLDLQEFKDFAAELHKAGHYVPRSWVWGMSIRDLPGHQ